MAIDPSPTADATRLMMPPRTSPTAKTSGKLVSSKYGGRARFQGAALRFSGVRSGPVCAGVNFGNIRSTRELVSGSPLGVLLIEVVSGAVAPRKSSLGPFEIHMRNRV